MSDESAAETVAPKQPAESALMGKEQQQLMASRLISSTFGNMVTVLMQSETHANMSLGQLRTRVVPALVRKQFRLAEGRTKGRGELIPIGLILWARVSDELHERMKGALDQPFDLAEADWASGENYWIIDAIGQQRFLAPLLTALRNTDFAGKTVHYRVKGSSGVQLKTFTDEQSASVEGAEVEPAEELEEPEKSQDAEAAD